MTVIARRIVKSVSVFAICVVLAGCKEEVFRGLTARDANDMYAVLANNGISASRDMKDDGTARLLVSTGDLPRSIQLLSAQGYPRETYRSLGEIFPGDGLIVSPLEQRARLVYGLSQELSRTISMIDSVSRSRVHLVLPEMELRGVQSTKPSASVAIYHRAGVDPAELSAKVRTIVANGVPGLSIRDVSVSAFAQDQRAGVANEASLMDTGSVRAFAFSPSALFWIIAGAAGLGAGAQLMRRSGHKKA
jgi:type III secretion protein J